MRCRLGIDLRYLHPKSIRMIREHEYELESMHDEVTKNVTKTPTCLRELTIFINGRFVENKCGQRNLLTAKTFKKARNCLKLVRPLL